jgi:hypothetical protein
VGRFRAVLLLTLPDRKGDIMRCRSTSLAQLLPCLFSAHNVASSQYEERYPSPVSARKVNCLEGCYTSLFVRKITTSAFFEEDFLDVRS